MKTKSNKNALIAGGVAAALSVLNNVAEASVISFDSGLTSSYAGGDVCFNPITGESTSSYTSSLPFDLCFSCESAQLWTSSSASGFTDLEVLIDGYSLALLSLGDSVSSTGEFSINSNQEDFQVADSYYAGFRFQTTEATDYNYGYCVFSIEDPTAWNSNVTLDSFHYESEAGVAIEVIPEPATMATLLGGALGLMMMRRAKKCSLFRS